MRILHAVEAYHPSVGGAQEVVRQVSAQLARRGHEVTVATSSFKGVAQTTWDGSVRVVRFDVSGNLARGIRGEVAAYLEFVRSGDFDVVMTYAAQQWTTDALLSCDRWDRERWVLATCGFSGLSDRRYESYYRQLEQKIGMFNAIITHSSTYQDAAWIRGARTGIVTVIPNGVDGREFAAPAVSPSESEIPTLRPMILTVGNHTGKKGHSLAMRTVLTLSRHLPVTLIIAGKQAGRLGCSRQCSATSWMLNIVSPHDIILKDVTRNDLLSLYRAADLFLFTSEVECSPLVLFEAAASGLPFVSVDVGNACEIASWTKAGIICSSRSPKRLAESVSDLLADAGERQRLTKAGMESMKTYTWDVIASKYEELYLSIVS
jgi:glycosyltransferase involved in cell wall biosynthesis